MKFIKSLHIAILILCFYGTSVLARPETLRIQDLLSGRTSTTTEETWTGKYFPPPKPTHSSHTEYSNKRVQMGVADDHCDNGKDHLDVDWNGDPSEYTCYDPLHRFEPVDIEPILSYSNIPFGYSAPHGCMNETLEYDGIPTFGIHRPLWAKWGEYRYVPPQRWVHNLEHGAVVMLYHPCTDPKQRAELTELVTSCLYRHIITPSNLLKSDRPFALVTWGNIIRFSMVEPNVVSNYIREHALKGPEKISREGQYDLELKKHAKVVSDIDDSELCPHL